MARLTPTPLELLAPARTADIAVAAINAGADAVYIGASSHGARRAAANSVAEIGHVCEFAHRFGAKVYATVNTIVYDDEIRAVERLVGELYRAGTDALIVQDMALLRMDLPPIELHASTQCDIRDAAKARFLADVGFSRLVLARELSLKEIAAIHAAVPDTPLEAFIHGALCVSYSGDCRASYVATGRSANRGECAQICRLPFDLIDGDGRPLVRGKHLLSLRDLNRSSVMPELAAAGVSSFKIEGRLKDEAYVRNAVGAYSRILDRLVAESDGRYIRQSAGTVRLGFNPSLDKSFNRGFTSYFLTGRAPSGGMASMSSPKATGTKIGTVTACNRKFITARLDAELANGDGLGFFTPAGIFTGFRLNRVEGNRLFPASPQTIPAGTALYRNRDKEFDDRIAASKSSRTLSVDMSLHVKAPDRVMLEMTDERGVSAAVVTVLDAPLQAAVTSQTGPRRKILDKLGATVYRAGRIVDLAGDVFIPASALATLRRDCVEALERASRMTYHYDYRRPEKPDAVLPQGSCLTVHDNVANRLASRFYTDHGATEIGAAVETGGDSTEAPVMTTRYCLRRELGHCLRYPEGRQWKGPLTLVSGPLKLRADFDCRTCRMNLYHIPDI